MSVTDDGVVTMLPSQRATVIKTVSESSVVYMLPYVSSTATDFLFIAEPSGNLVTEAGDRLITESGDTLITET